MFTLTDLLRPPQVHVIAGNTDISLKFIAYSLIMESTKKPIPAVAPMVSLRVRNMLRRIKCNMTVPYWDRSTWVRRPFAASIRGGENHHIGGNGAGTVGCVRDGRFRQVLGFFLLEVVSRVTLAI